MSPESDNQVSGEPEDVPQRRDEQGEPDDHLQLILDAEDHTPEEAGYGHGV